MTAARRASVHSKAAEAMREVLSDGQWHLLEDVIRVGAPYVPRHTAMAEYHQQVTRKRKGGIPRDKRDVPDLVRTGRWYLCRRLLLGWAHSGTVQIDPPGWRALNKRVRLTPPAGPGR